MLKIALNGSIEVTIDHLMDDRPTTFEGVVDRYRKLDITLFHHIVSSPDCRYERKYGQGRVPDTVRTMSPPERLQSILKAGEIQGNPKGYFVNKHKQSLTAAQVDAIKSVSFALCSMGDVPRHFAARDSQDDLVVLATNGVHRVAFEPEGVIQ